MALRVTPVQPPISEEAVKLGELLREARGSRPLREIQARCGTKPDGRPFVSLNTLSLVEHGRRGVSPEMLERIVNAVNADPVKAFRLAGQVAPRAAADVLGAEVAYALQGGGLSEDARRALRRIHLTRLADNFSGFIVHPPVPVDALLQEELGISLTADPDIAWGRFTTSTSISYASGLDEDGRSADRNFVLAHLAAHALIAREAGRPPRCEHESGGRMEAEATWMAGAILLPGSALASRFEFLRGIHIGQAGGGGLMALLGELGSDFRAPIWLTVRQVAESGRLAWAFGEDDL